MITRTETDLTAILGDCWSRLIAGATDRRSPLHQATVATVDPDGAPDLRIMVLRQVDRNQRWAQLHTDRRAGKIAHLRRDARSGLLFYDPEARVQIRLGGRMVVHLDDPVAVDAWSRAQRMSRVCYAAEFGPGAPIEAPSAALRHLDAGADGEDGFANFAVLRFHIETLEWLSLAAAGHKRARFSLAGSASLGQWLAP